MLEKNGPGINPKFFSWGGEWPPTIWGVSKLLPAPAPPSLRLRRRLVFISEAEPREAVILDADVRICRDVHEMAHATAEASAKGGKDGRTGGFGGGKKRCRRTGRFFSVFGFSFFFVKISFPSFTQRTPRNAGG